MEEQFQHEGYILTEYDELELSLSCSNINTEHQSFNIYPQLRFYIEKQGTFHLVDQTEVVKKSRNPVFTQKFLLGYTYEWTRKIRFELLDYRNPEDVLFLGQAVVSIGDIISSKNRKVRVDMSNLTQNICELEVAWNIPVNSSKFINLTAEVIEFNDNKGWFFKKQKSYFYRLGRYINRDDFVKVYQSEPINDGKSMVWKTHEFRVTMLSQNDMTRPIKFKLITTENNQEKTIAETFFSIHEILHEKNQFVLADSDMQKSLGKVQFQCDMFESHNALDYLRAGLKLNFLLGIDYTDSYTNSFSSPSESITKFNSNHSNHLADKEGETKYTKALKTVIPILMDYSKDKKIAMYGFGGKPENEKSSQEKQTCFSLTGDPNNPWIDGLQSALDTYKASPESVTRGGPKNFEDIFQKAALSAKYNRMIGIREFTVAVIFTDGNVSDVRETLDCIYNSGDLPIMFIIVGVGKGDFEYMEILDGDEALRDKKGKDIVKFLALKEFRSHSHLIPYELLRKFPVHLTSYMHKNNATIHSFEKEISQDMKPLLEMREKVYGTQIDTKECENEIKETTKKILLNRKKSALLGK